MQESPLLSSEISGYDLNDEVKNEKYNKEINILFNEILEDLNQADINNYGHISEDELLNFLQKKLPPGKKLNVPLFQKLIQEIDRNIDMNIDLNEFCKKYIQAHEELKLNFETLKKGLDKEKNQKSVIESKIQEVKQEKLNINNISPNACVSTMVGKITFLAQMNFDSIYFSVALDDIEKKTSIKNIDNANFIEKITFRIQDKQSTLSYKLFSANNNQFIGCTDVPLYIINTDNEEINPEFELKDDNNQAIAVFRPKIIIVTSYYDMYQKKYENIDKNIESYQNKIIDLKQNLDDISLPYKKIFENSEIRLLKGAETIINYGQGDLVQGVEGVLQNFFKDKKVKWVFTLKIILYLNIFILLFTTLIKPDFISLFICLILLLFINTDKTNYFFEQFDKILIGILIMIAYDIFDFLLLRKNIIEAMSSVDGWGKFFGFLGFLGKITLFLASLIIKNKYGKTGIITE
jgi:hypothetical protein